MYEASSVAECFPLIPSWGLALTAGSLPYLPTGIGAVIYRTSLKIE